MGYLYNMMMSKTKQKITFLKLVNRYLEKCLIEMSGSAEQIKQGLVALKLERH